MIYYRKKVDNKETTNVHGKKIRFKVSNKLTRVLCEIYSKLIILFCHLVDPVPKIVHPSINLFGNLFYSECIPPVSGRTQLLAKELLWINIIHFWKKAIQFLMFNWKNHGPSRHLPVFKFNKKRPPEWHYWKSKCRSSKQLLICQYSTGKIPTISKNCKVFGI